MGVLAQCVRASRVCVCVCAWRGGGVIQSRVTYGLPVTQIPSLPYTSQSAMYLTCIGNADLKQTDPDKRKIGYIMSFDGV